MLKSLASFLRRLPRPRLSLRLTMVAIVFVGIGLGIITSARRQEETVAMARGLGGQVSYDWQYRFDPADLSQPPRPRWLVDFVGPDFLSNVTKITFQGEPTKLDEAFVVRFGEFRQLEELRFGHAPALSDDGLARLSGLTRLRTLDLSGTGITGRGFAHLKGMKRLRFLHARNVRTRDDDLSNLSGLTDLMSLVLQGDQLTDAGLAHLRPLKNLRSLQILNNGTMKISSSGLSHLSGMPNLEQLALWSSKFDDLEPLRGLGNLRYLMLVNAGLDDDALAPLADLEKLELLSLSGSNQKFGDAGLNHLANLGSLQNLFLQDTKVTDRGLWILAGMTNLEALFLDGTGVTDDALIFLARLPKLQMLSLDRTAITDEGLFRFTRFPSLNDLSLKETKTTRRKIAVLKAAMPWVQIDH